MARTRSNSLTHLGESAPTENTACPTHNGIRQPWDQAPPIAETRQRRHRLETNVIKPTHKCTQPSHPEGVSHAPLPAVLQRLRPCHHACRSGRELHSQAPYPDAHRSPSETTAAPDRIGPSVMSIDPSRIFQSVPHPEYSLSLPGQSGLRPHNGPDPSAGACNRDRERSELSGSLRTAEA